MVKMVFENAPPTFDSSKTSTSKTSTSSGDFLDRFRESRAQSVDPGVEAQISESSRDFVQPVSESDLDKIVSSVDTPSRSSSSRDSTGVVSDSGQSVPLVSTPSERSFDPVRDSFSVIDVPPDDDTFRRPSALREAGSGFLEAAGAFSGLRSDPSLVGRVQSGGGTFGEEAGAVVGGLGFALGGDVGEAGFVLGATGRSALQTSRVGQFVTKSRVGRFAAGLGEGTAETLAIIELSKALGRSRSSPEAQEFAKTDAFKEAVKAGRSSEKEALMSTGFSIGDKTVSPRGFLFEFVGGFTGGKKGREAFREGVSSSLVEQGFSPETVSKGVEGAQSLRKAVNIGEVGSLLNIGRFTERFGRSEVTKTFE